MKVAFTLSKITPMKAPSYSQPGQNGIRLVPGEGLQADGLWTILIPTSPGFALVVDRFMRKIKYGLQARRIP